jgi:hypothetical protein
MGAVHASCGWVWGVYSSSTVTLAETLQVPTLTAASAILLLLSALCLLSYNYTAASQETLQLA